MWRCVVLLLAAVLTGCGGSPGGFGRAMTYPANVTRVAMDDDTYRVHEHATDNTIMTTSSIGAAAASGFAKGLTLGMATPNAPEVRHEAAARKYLDDTGRADCTIVSGYLLVQPQYEFTYECPS